MSTVSLKNIYKIYDNNVEAVHDFNLDIKDEEFIVFVGPSGCGKSTTLRMIAGLEDITKGELYIDDVLSNDIEAKKRGIAMVFQNYALYPHMTVYDNLSFYLQNSKINKNTIDKKVNEVAKLLGLEEYLKRRPKELSGGQRQRVALGRAIIRDAKVYLMDEPLSNLDAKLRVQMRTEILSLQKKIKGTTIYVTHDQTEAMTMADRIVVMNNGLIQQIGTPKDVYTNPVNIFVAGFLGSPQINFLDGKYKNGYFIVNDNFKIGIPELYRSILEKYVGKDLVFGIRPEDVYMDEIVKETYPETIFKFNISIKEMLGHEYILDGDIEGINFKVRSALRFVSDNNSLDVAFDMNKFHIFDKDSEKVII